MSSQARVSDAQNKVLDAKNKYLLEAFEESAKLESDLAMAEEQLKETRDVFAHTEVRAPVAGIVKHLNINTLGGVMRSGDQLMEISPTESELIVEIRISPADIGQLELGLPVGISLDAFDSSIYGKLEGELVYLSSDTLSEKDAQGRTDTYYRGRVRVDQEAKATDSKLAVLELRPGMTAGVDVRTGKRTVLHFLAKPILRGFSGALTQK
jgi:adhesin transport system membrane fusion protein